VHLIRSKCSIFNSIVQTFLDLPTKIEAEVMGQLHEYLESPAMADANYTVQIHYCSRFTTAR
jgi:hypothetical protein